MALSSQEKAFLGNFQREFNDLSDTVMKLKTNSVLYTKRTYSLLIDADLAEVEITASQLSAGVNLVTQLSNLLGAAATSVDDWQAALDQIRRL